MLSSRSRVSFRGRTSTLSRRTYTTENGDGESSDPNTWRKAKTFLGISIPASSEIAQPKRTEVKTSARQPPSVRTGIRETTQPRPPRLSFTSAPPSWRGPSPSGPRPTTTSHSPAAQKSSPPYIGRGQPRTTPSFPSMTSETARKWAEIRRNGPPSSQSSRGKVAASGRGGRGRGRGRGTRQFNADAFETADGEKDERAPRREREDAEEDENPFEDPEEDLPDERDLDIEDGDEELEQIGIEGAQSAYERNVWPEYNLTGPDIPSFAMAHRRPVDLEYSRVPGLVHAMSRSSGAPPSAVRDWGRGRLGGDYSKHQPYDVDDYGCPPQFLDPLSHASLFVSRNPEIGGRVLHTIKAMMSTIQPAEGVDMKHYLEKENGKNNEEEL
ncbi:hypothetical protein DL96DRAFT_1702503 [Flagelloscypha sp. PMI_526]|nr:hypothetical protein DL96DRAFT_1702503 [Flagelloscypha sp. PMI_526]